LAASKRCCTGIKGRIGSTAGLDRVKPAVSATVFWKMGRVPRQRGKLKNAC